MTIVAALPIITTAIFSACGKNKFVPADYARPADYVDGGSITADFLDTASEISVPINAYGGDITKDYRDTEFYTYNYCVGDTSCWVWNPHNFETADDAKILSYITAGLYDFVLNEDKDGYAIIPEAADGYPVDVTADYAGRFGVECGDTAKAFKIKLNRYAAWSSGEKITADDYIYSARELLNPKMQNRRADSLYEGAFKLYNAKKYFYGEEVDFNNVGIVKTGEYEMVLIVENPVELPQYFVPYNLSSSFLVNKNLYEGCKRFYDKNGVELPCDDDTCVRVTTSYNTSAATTESFGPYKLSYFENNKQFTLTRNENFFGYHDGKHFGQYQTDKISVQSINKHATCTEAFLKGELDIIGLQSEDLERFGASGNIRYTPQDYTTKLSFNTDYQSLVSHGTNSQILVLDEFRQAFSLAIDRATFAAAYTSAGEAGYGLLNGMYVCDPVSGARYRETDCAKDAVCGIYGAEYEEITGYDLGRAQKLMQTAYEKALDLGIFSDTAVASLEIRVYSDDDIYVRMFNCLNAALKNACRGTGFEGKVSLTMRADADYYATMYAGGTDMIFTTWGGSTANPYSLLYECYCDDGFGGGRQMEYGFDTTSVTVTLTVNGQRYTASLQTWAKWLNSAAEIKSETGVTLAPFTSFDYAARCAFFAVLEETYLGFFTTTPLYYKCAASMLSDKGDFAVTEYVEGVEFGGLRYYTYNYTDAEWAAKTAAAKGN